MTSKELIKSFIRSKKWSYIIGIIVLIMTSVIASLIPKILGIITDGLNKKDIQEGYVHKYVILMVAAAVAVFVLRFTWRYFLIGKQLLQQFLKRYRKI